LRRLDAATGKSVWPGDRVSLEAHDQPAARGRKDYPGPAVLQPSKNSSWPGPPGLVTSTQELDRGGSGDLVVVVSRSLPCLLAVSGKTGQVLWWFLARRTPPQGMKEGDLQADHLLNHATVLGQPVVADVNGDGTPDFITTFATTDGLKPNQWVEAVSGKNGQSLWRHDIGPPDDKASGQTSYAAVLTQFDRKPIIAIAVGSRLLALDLRSGKEVWPTHDLGHERLRALQFIALSGHGPVDALLLEKQAGDGIVVEVLSLRDRKRLWQALEIADTSPSVGWPEQEPLVAALQKGGRPQVVTCNGQGTFTHNYDATVTVRDAATGEICWSRGWPRLQRDHGGPTVGGLFSPRLLVGPDVNGDGHGELFVASFARGRDGLHPEEGSLFIDCLSGQDGHTLWWSQVDSLVSPGSVAFFDWWQPGPDGWPLLVVSCRRSVTARVDAGKWDTYVLGATTGRVEYRLPAFHAVGVADLNRDGLADLYGAVDGGKVRAFRGVPPELWRLLGTKWRLARNLEGDSIEDLIGESDQGDTIVLSGRDLHVLWQGHPGDLHRLIIGKGDGQGAGLSIRDGKLYGKRKGTVDEMWSWTLPGGKGAILELQQARPGHAATVAVVCGDAVYGLDVSTGQPQWRCEVEEGASPFLLHTDDSEALPRVVFPRGSSLICRMALPVSPTGEYLAPTPPPTSYGPLPEDPRLVRPLPWYPAWIASPYREFILGIILLGVLFIFPVLFYVVLVVGLVIPGSLLRSAWRRRSWRLVLLPVPGLAALGILLTLIFGRMGQGDALAHLARSVAQGTFAFGPPLLYGGIVLHAGFRRKWKMCGWLLAVYPLTTLGIAGLWLAIDARDLQPPEHYSWRGWYIVGIPGAGAAVIVCLGAFCVLRLRMGKRLAGQAPPRPQAV
jgi:outer membrane protein assembly factor BamB